VTWETVFKILRWSGRCSFCHYVSDTSVGTCAGGLKMSGGWRGRRREANRSAYRALGFGLWALLIVTLVRIWQYSDAFSIDWWQTLGIIVVATFGKPFGGGKG